MNRWSNIATAGILLGMPAIGNAQNVRVYNESVIAHGSGGVDLARGLALTNHFWLQVIGPTDIEATVLDYAKDCAKSAAEAAVIAAYEAPSPEPSARVQAGWAAAKISLQSCAEADPAAKYAVKRFYLHIDRRGEWEPTFRAELHNPTVPFVNDGISRLPPAVREPAGRGYDAWNRLQPSTSIPPLAVPTLRFPQLPDPGPCSVVRNPFGNGCR